MIVFCIWIGGLFFLSNGEEDWNMLLKDFIEIKGWVVKNVEEVGWVVG